MISRLFTHAPLISGVTLALALAGCGGGDGGAASTLSGTAAVGDPIVGGTVNITCAAGPAVTGIPKTSSAGAWSATLSGQTLPCAVEVSGGNLGTAGGAANNQTYRSLANAFGTVNITPLTDLLVANLTASTAALTQAQLAAFNTGSTPLTTRIDTALANLRTALKIAALNSINPITTPFNPTGGVPMDDILTSLRTAMSSATLTHANLLSAAANNSGGAIAFPTGFDPAAAYDNTASGSGATSAPSAPTVVSTNNVTASNVTIQWQPVATATAYSVFRSTTSPVVASEVNRITTPPTDNTSFTDTGLTASTTYHYVVTAINGIGQSPASADVSATTLANGGATPTHTVGGLTPSSGVVGSTVTITGTDFDPDPFHMLVTFASNVPATVTSATATQLVVTVPAGAVSGAIKVTNGLTTREVTSSSSFTVTTSGGGGGSTATWTQRSSGTSYILNTVAYGNSIFVAGGNGNTITTSTDGITWTSRSSASSALPDANYFAVNNIAWSSALNLFVAVGDRVGTSGTPLLATSPDGVTWTRRAWTNDLNVANLWDIAADSTRVTVVGEKTILVSTDGSTWSSQTINNIGGMSLTGVASSGAIRVAVGTYNSSTGLMLVSTDGTTWASATTPAGFTPQDVAWNGSLFVAVGSSSPLQFGATPVIATSTDGLNWALQTVPSSIRSSAFVLNDITWDGTRFVAVGSPYALVNSRLFLTSSDGVTWMVDATIITGSGQKVPNGVASNGTRTVSVGDTVFTRDF